PAACGAEQPELAAGSVVDVPDAAQLPAAARAEALLGRALRLVLVERDAVLLPDLAVPVGAQGAAAIPRIVGVAVAPPEHTDLVHACAVFGVIGVALLEVIPLIFRLIHLQVFCLEVIDLDEQSHFASLLRRGRRSGRRVAAV